MADADKIVVLGSDKPSSEAVATSLRFAGPSQSGSFSPANYGSEASSGPSDGKPDSPIVTSPVSERIKALEALAAKKEPEPKTDGGLPHFKERHYEKSPTEAPAETTSPFQKKGASTDQDSPESPFEVLGEARQGSEFEDTAEWMRAHLPPVPDFEDKVDLSKDALVLEKDGKSQEIKGADKVVADVPEAFACVPDAFMDSPIEGPKLKNVFKDPAQQSSVEEESEFDLSFLPTAYMTDTQGPPDLDSELPASPAPPSGFDSPPQPPPSDSNEKDSKTKQAPWGGEVVEVDSSGDSDDTVIEDAASILAPSIPAPSLSSDTAPAPNPSVPSLPTEEKETPPAKQPMRVPTINVIETDEPNYSDDEMEMEVEEEEECSEVVKETPKIPEPQPDVTKKESSNIPPLEYEGYSPPSSPVDSDAEYSPKHKILKSECDTDNQKTTASNDGMQSAAVSKSSTYEVSQAQKVESDKSETPNESNEKSSPSTAKPSEKTAENISDFPDYDDDDWSTDAQDILVKSSSANVTVQDPPLHPISKFEEKPMSDIKEDNMQTVEFSKSNYMQDDTIRKSDRQSFEDEDALPPTDDTIDDKELNFDNVPEPSPSDPTSPIHIETLLPQNNATTMISDLENITSMDEESFPKPVGGQPSPRKFPKDPFSSFQSEPPGNTMEPKTEKKPNDDIMADSMVNSKTLPPQEAGLEKDSKAGHHSPDNTSDPESIEPDCSVSGATDSFVEFMRECLKSRQDEDPEDLRQGLTGKDACLQTGTPPSQSTPTMVMDLEQERLTIKALKELGSSQEEEDDLQSSIKASEKSQSSFTSTTSDHPSPQNKPASDSAYSKEVEAIDVWVAEAYHLAEHVLAAILTHLSVKDLVHWRDPKKSGVVFGLSLLTLLSLAAFSVISVISYLLLALLCVTITFRIYKSVVQAVQKSNDGHPFKALMEKDVSIPPETFRKHVDVSLTYINRFLKQMSKLFLVEDIIDSLKLAVVMWLLTYVGAVFNGITIFILADILLFAVPPFYEKNKTQIDHYMEIVRTQVNTTMAKLQEKLPGAIKRTKAE
ncbi:reticulon-3 isoform X1 [Coregonus clupeaformis]|uniref:reticulon-3 isoform X1 n=1 Tax=Coregonus clupeaformis TaxID=59861 RepID=UPI001BE0EF27|nr:reticulon-3 isoform X1 [Coregonus clupeaformis]